MKNDLGRESLHKIQWETLAYEIVLQKLNVDRNGIPNEEAE